MISETQIFIAFVVVILLVNLLIAVIDWKWGRGIGFTALALLAIAFYVYFSVLILQGVRQNIEKELAEPQSWASFSAGLGMDYWYIIEIPIILGLGIGAVALAALSRQRGLDHWQRSRANSDHLGASSGHQD
jgi:presenilin-like A22 family membrane protease